MGRRGKYLHNYQEIDVINEDHSFIIINRLNQEPKSHSNVGAVCAMSLSVS